MNLMSPFSSVVLFLLFQCRLVSCQVHEIPGLVMYLFVNYRQWVELQYLFQSWQILLVKSSLVQWLQLGFLAWKSVILPWS